MKELSVRERNEAIARFVGNALVYCDDCGTPYPRSKDRLCLECLSESGIYDVGMTPLFAKGKLVSPKLFYHSSWDMLMPAFEKVNKKVIQNGGHFINIYWYGAEVEKIERNTDDTLIESVFRAVSDFCIEYNKTNKEND